MESLVPRQLVNFISNHRAKFFGLRLVSCELLFYRGFRRVGLVLQFRLKCAIGGASCRDSLAKHRKDGRYRCAMSDTMCW